MYVINCCKEVIPGYFCQNIMFELFGPGSVKNNNYYNPYSSSHRIQQLGDMLDEAAHNFTLWNDASEFLMKCKYKQPFNEKLPENNELNILSLNIQYLTVSKFSTMREEIELFQKFDVICFNETNCKLKKEDLILDGFYEPLVQKPTRSSRKGGGLVTWVNTRVCDENEIVPVPTYSEPGNNSGEFQFFKITNCKKSKKSVLIGNVYRSPSLNPNKFNELFNKVLQKL